MALSGGHGLPSVPTTHLASDARDGARVGHSAATSGLAPRLEALVLWPSGRVSRAMCHAIWARTLPLAPGECDDDPWPDAQAMTGRTRIAARNLTPDPPFDRVLAAAQTGAGWARTRLYEWLAPVVAGYLRARGARDPDDLTNDAFVRVFSGCGSFVGNEAQFRSWVLRIAHCRLVDARRAQSRRPEMESLDTEHRPLQDEPTTATAEDEALRSLGTERMRRLLDALTPDQRDVLALRLIAGLTVKDVAALLAKQPGAVKALNRRALSALRRKLANNALRL
jgi:RNA polymerase sigma factor (sigma-70 family)